MADQYQAVNVCSMRRTDSAAYFWCPNITDDIRHGTYSYEDDSDGFVIVRYIDYYGVMMFNNAALIAKYATHSPVSAQLKMTRTGSGGSSSKVATLYAGTQTDMPNISSTSPSTKAVPVPHVGGYNYTISAGEDAKTLDIDISLVESLCTGESDCLYLYCGRSTAKYMSFEGRDDITKTILEVTWLARTVPLKTWTGTEWKTATSVQTWTGTEWKEATELKTYDGVAWNTSQ